MQTLSNMVSMARTPAEKEEAAEASIPSPMNQPDYPYGLCISLGEEELTKLGFEHAELSVNDMVHIHAMGTVTSVSSHDNVNSGPSCRVEIQLTHLQAEDEDKEFEDKKKPTSEKISKLYSKS